MTARRAAAKAAAPRRRPPSRAILLVEDDEHVRHLVRLTLEEAGYGVDEAGDGEEALARLAERPYAAIVLDLMMPRVDGFEVLERLDGLPGRRGTPVVVITARHDPGPVLRTIGAGATDHVRKPFTTEDLLAAVARAISGKGVDERRGELWRSAQVYESAGLLQSLAAAPATAEEPRRRFGRR